MAELVLSDPAYRRYQAAYITPGTMLTHQSRFHCGVRIVKKNNTKMLAMPVPALPTDKHTAIMVNNGHVNLIVSKDRS